MGDRAVKLPKDAMLAELRPESLSFETYQCLIPGTRVELKLFMEGHALPLDVAVARTEVVTKDRRGYRYCSYIALDGLPSTDRALIELFIKKGRGEPEIAP